MPTATTRTELAHRHNDGIDVSLLWSRSDGSIAVVVQLLELADSFELEVDPAQALDAFHHPFAYAARLDPKVLELAA